MDSEKAFHRQMQWSNYVKIYATTQKKRTKCEKKRSGITGAVFFYLTQAYDKVWRDALIVKMQKMGIGNEMLNWIREFLRCRKIQVQVGEKLSSIRTLDEGLPQGSVLSCTLFNIYTNDICTTIECLAGEKVHKSLYVDDLAIRVNRHQVKKVNKVLQTAVDEIGNFCEKYNMTISTDKTVCITFTHTTKRERRPLAIKIKDKDIKTVDEVKFLGITLDRNINLNRHCDIIATKARSMLVRL